MPLRGTSCKLRFARIKAKLKLQDGLSVAKIITAAVYLHSVVS